MEIYLIILMVLMILGSIYTLHAKDLMSAIISLGIVGFGVVISFLLLSAPDLAIVQVVVEIITLTTTIAVITTVTYELEKKKIGYSSIFYAATIILFTAVFYVVFSRISNSVTAFGDHFFRMTDAYITAANESGSANLVTGIILHFRAYDTLGEATVLVTAVIGVVTILRLHGKKKETEKE
jgi:multisubunit Na+/H+ antiporter MnhB subunit